jgi:uncharacterized protein (DUF305 family)
MNLTEPKLVLLAAAVGFALALTGCGSSVTDDNTGSAAPPAASSSTASSTGSATPASSPHNDGDVLFAQMMIPHHNQAIEMSDMLLAKSGVDPKVTALAEKIKDAQGPEVTQMTGWLKSWGEDPSIGSAGSADPSTGAMGGMDHGSGDGMMSKADMDALKAADGAKATTLFLTGMIEHHTGAITMANAELEQGANPDAQQLAQTIIKTQQAEITTMKQLAGS